MGKQLLENIWIECIKKQHSKKFPEGNYVSGWNDAFKVIGRLLRKLSKVWCSHQVWNKNIQNWTDTIHGIVIPDSWDICPVEGCHKERPKEMTSQLARKEYCFIWHKDSMRRASISFKLGTECLNTYLFDSCKFVGVGEIYDVDDWEFIKDLSEEVLRLVKQEAVNE